MKKELKVWAMTIIAFWWLAPNEIIAQQQDSTGSRYLDEVLVTSSKFPKTRARTGQVVDVITSEDIRNSGSADLAQLLHDRTGIFVNGANSNPGKDLGIYLRGAGPRYTLLMIDGIPVYDPSGVNGVFDLRLLSLANVESIEIMKGPQSTLYGSDAMAGVINIITKEGAGGLQPSLQASYGSYNQWDLRGNISGSADKVSFSAGYTYRGSSGISEARPFTDDQDFENDPFRRHALDLRTIIRAGENISVAPFLNYSRADGDYDNGAFSDAIENRYDLQNIRYGASVRGGQKNAWQVQLAHHLTDRKFISSFGEFSGNGGFLHAEAFYLHHFSEKWQAMAGFTFQEQRLKGDGLEDATLSSPYLTLFFAPYRTLQLEGGVRLNHHSAFGDEVTVSLNPSWRLAPSLKAFGNYTTGFKAPTLDQLFGQFGPNPDLQPEKSQSLEGGIAWFRRGSDIQLTVFRRRIEDIIIYTDRYINSDLQDVTGIEVTPRFTVVEGLVLTGNYTWLKGRSEFTEADSSFSGLLRQPEHSFRMGIDYSISRRVSARASVQYFGKRNDVYFDPADFSTKMTELDPYVLLNAGLTYSTEWFRIFGEVRNLLDADYFESYGYSILGRNLQIGFSWQLPDG